MILIQREGTHNGTRVASGSDNVSELSYPLNLLVWQLLGKG